MQRSAPYFDPAASNTVVEVGTGMMELHTAEGENPNAADMWLHFFDSEAADVTLGVTVPDLSYLIPAGDGTLYGAMDKSFPTPAGFAKGLSYAVTNAKNGSGSAPAVACVVNLTTRRIRRGE